jgi:hypothetical protein
MIMIGCQVGRKLPQKSRRRLGDLRRLGIWDLSQPQVVALGPKIELAATKAHHVLTAQIHGGNITNRILPSSPASAIL